jgi:hypothetical protein
MIIGGITAFHNVAVAVIAIVSATCSIQTNVSAFTPIVSSTQRRHIGELYMAGENGDSGDSQALNKWSRYVYFFM